MIKAAGGKGTDGGVWGPGTEAPGSPAAGLGFPSGLAQGLLFPMWGGLRVQRGPSVVTRVSRAKLRNPLSLAFSAQVDAPSSLCP